MLNGNIEIQIQEELVDNKNNFLLSELEPDYKHNFMEVGFMASNTNFEILDIDKIGETYKIINYEDIKELDIDSILVSIKLKDGTIYLLHEQRDLTEILKDFSHNLIITNTNIDSLTCMYEFNLSEQNDGIILVGKRFDVDNYEEIDEEISFKIDLDEILNVEEIYYGGDDDRNVKINLTDNKYIIFQGC